MVDFRGQKVGLGDIIYFSFGFSISSSHMFLGIVKKFTDRGIKLFTKNSTELIWGNFEENLSNRILKVNKDNLYLHEQKEVKDIITNHDLNMEI